MGSSVMASWMLLNHQNDQFKRSLLQDLNRHATVVLEGRIFDVEAEDTRIVAEAITRVNQVVRKADSETTRDSNQERLERMSKLAELEDLQVLHVGRLKDAMSNGYSQLEAMKESVQSDLQHQVSLLVRPMQQALDAVRTLRRRLAEKNP